MSEQTLIIKLVSPLVDTKKKAKEECKISVWQSKKPKQITTTLFICYTTSPPSRHHKTETYSRNLWVQTSPIYLFTHSNKLLLKTKSETSLDKQGKRYFLQFSAWEEGKNKSAAALKRRYLRDLKALKFNFTHHL